MTGSTFLTALCVSAIIVAMLWVILNLICGDDE